MLPDIDAVALTAKSMKFYDLASTFRALTDQTNIGKLWELLGHVFQIHLRAENRSEPFGPMMQLAEGRSMIPSDLTDADRSVLRDVLDKSRLPAVHARLGDILWVAQKDAAAGRLAVDGYLALGLLLEDADMWPPCMECYERGIRLAATLGKKDPLLSKALDHLATRVTHYDAEDPSFFTAKAIDLLFEFPTANVERFADLALKAARKRVSIGDQYAARHYFLTTSRLLKKAKRSEELEAVSISVAETWVAEADAAEIAGSHMAAQAHLNDAIQAYRETKTLKHLIPALHKRMDDAGQKALASMKPIGTEIDIGDFVRASRQAVQGLSLDEAVWSLTAMARLLEPTKLREQVLDQAKNAPLSSMFGVSVYDREGRIVHKHPGLHTSDLEEREQAIEALMARQANMMRALTVNAQLAPAFVEVLGEHVVEDVDITRLLADSAFVPEGREPIFASAFSAGFRRDMMVAMHLLIPQVEHVLRSLLRQNKTITTSIDADGIQGEWPLKRLLDTPELGHIVGEAVVFELRSLLIYKGSSNLRNRLCHGLIRPEEFGSVDIFYLWWLLLKLSLCMTPKFQEWMEEYNHQPDGDSTQASSTPQSPEEST